MREREAFLLVYSVIDRQSYDDVLSFWEQLQDIHENGVPVVIVANKSDFSKEERVVTDKEGQEIAKFCNNSDYIETSAKTGNNVEKAFQTLIKKMRKSRPAAQSSGGGKKKKKSGCTVL
eukprot:TRINITY_DN2217_c2_g3_i1.p1 TRINITY_DN2217_c2_g3~~TRINITY_DN2217_c2_g3_i1.p1  ORF type:complete len:119 (+),score=31.05 TRINITY_DN2217_c2_g3_i1:327-683(+)